MYWIGVCQWEPYSAWTPCSQSCAGGLQSRSRLQVWIRGPAAGVDGIQRIECAGAGSEDRECNLQPCPSKNLDQCWNFRKWQKYCFGIFLYGDIILSCLQYSKLRMVCIFLLDTLQSRLWWWLSNENTKSSCWAWKWRKILWRMCNWFPRMQRSTLCKYVLIYIVKQYAMIFWNVNYIFWACYSIKWNHNRKLQMGSLARMVWMYFTVWRWNSKSHTRCTTGCCEWRRRMRRRASAIPRLQHTKMSKYVISTFL